MGYVTLYLLCAIIPYILFFCARSYLFGQAGYVSAEHPEGNFKRERDAIVYSRLGPIHAEMWSLSCNNKCCNLMPSGRQEGVFFFSPVTGAGDEIGWDFIKRVQTSRISFTGFCKEMTRFYQTNNLMSAPFMSTTTFISWVFGWLSKFKIDFRKDGLDDWCGYNPPILACDGTHIGVAVRHQKLNNHITREELPDDKVIPKHKR